MQVKAEVDDSLWEEVTRKSQQSDENEIIIAAIKALIEMTPEPPLPKPEPLIPAEAPPPALLPPPIASPSQSKFFGQFMISRGIIDETQFNEAIKQVQREHGRVGEIAVDKGFLSSQQAKELNRLQHSEDMPFGALAVERDLLTHHQLEEILKTQTTQGLRIGDAIKQLGFATEEAIESAFRDFEKEAEIEAKTEHPILHPDLFGIREAELLVDTFPKIVMRLTGLPSKLSRGIPFNPKV
ncbi:MAG: hypothetical protein VYA34_16500, partial [Myxococcota bacterium]|nr:hypothetical protein [Myxococcota bacterium]